MSPLTLTRAMIFGAVAIGWFGMASSQTSAVIDSFGVCKPTELRGCTRTWSTKEKKCILECNSEPMPFIGLPIVVSGPLPGQPTGPATPGTNRMEPRQLREIIRSGTVAQRAQVADWLATPALTLALDAAPKPLSAELLTPELRGILKTIREGTEKERAAAAERLFRTAP